MSKLEDAAFGLSQDELQQIRYLEILKRRKAKHPGKKFSDRMSVEAQIAMQQAMEDMENDKQLPEQNGAKEEKEKEADDKNAQISQPERGGETSNVDSGKTSRPASGKQLQKRSASESALSDSSGGRPRSRSEKRISFSQLYERHGSTRMPEDITDEDYSDDQCQKQVLGGAGKLPNAMEIIEFVNHDNPASSQMDNDVIEALAKINSVEKCEVWMQATADDEGDVRLDSEVFEQREHEVG